MDTCIAWSRYPAKKGGLPLTTMCSMGGLLSAVLVCGKQAAIPFSGNRLLAQVLHENTVTVQTNGTFYPAHFLYGFNRPSPKDGRLNNWWERVDSNHWSQRQQIYSLPPLATRELSHIQLKGGAGGRIRTPDLLITKKLVDFVWKSNFLHHFSKFFVIIL